MVTGPHVRRPRADDRARAGQPRQWPRRPGNRGAQETDDTQTPGVVRASRAGAFLQGTALAGIAAFLAACTGTKASSAPSATAAASASEAAAASTAVAASPRLAPTFTPTPKVITGPLKFANWPAYIDLTTEADADDGELPAGSSQTLEDFKKKYSVEVDYVEKIDDQPVVLRDHPAGARPATSRPAGT